MGEMMAVSRLGPVRDADGRIVRRVRVVRLEMTCTECGETTTDRFCRRCNGGDEGEDGDGVVWNGRRNGNGVSSGNLVPTVSYLREDEYYEGGGQ